VQLVNTGNINVDLTLYSKRRIMLPPNGLIIAEAAAERIEIPLLNVHDSRPQRRASPPGRMNPGIKWFPTDIPPVRSDCAASLAQRSRLQQKSSSSICLSGVALVWPSSSWPFFLLAIDTRPLVATLTLVVLRSFLSFPPRVSR